MSKLVDELINQHRVITDALDKVRSLGVGSEEGQKTLLAVKNSLLAHLKKEDKELYPALRKAAESDINLKRALNMYAKDMDEISKAAFEFFEKYSTGEFGLEFAEDFGALWGMLSQRIMKEEISLYKKYDKLV